jgi:imidazolonepropionase-like amidohydrolase
MIGSIAAGHDADLVIWSGDPLATQSWVETVVIRGEVVYEKSKDARLRRLLEATVEGQ